MSNVVHLYQDWNAREQQALLNLFADLSARRVADHWEKALTDCRDPQFFVFSDHAPDAVLTVSRIWKDGRRLYVVQSRHGHVLAAEGELERAIYLACHQRRQGTDGRLREDQFFNAVLAYFGVGAAQVLGYGSTGMRLDEALTELMPWMFPVLSSIA
jgi:hypothetical protein